jgi:SAM-dependent methyltransferase
MSLILSGAATDDDQSPLCQPALGAIAMPTLDLTSGYDYERLIEEEKTHYTDIEITEDLKEGGVHAHDSWHYYWLGVAEVIKRSPFSNFAEFLEERFAHLERPLRILSLASGYCGHELLLAQDLSCDYQLTCTDINGDLFAEARSRAQENGLSVDFQEADLNFMEIENDSFDMIFAHAAIHHVINLEQLFSRIREGLAPQGIFHMVEVVGENRRLIWDRNEKLANALLDTLPENLTDGIRLAVPYDEEGMEGIRQEDILPVLHSSFSPLFEYRHGAFMRFLCTHGELGKKLNPGDPRARRYLDFLIETDRSAVRNGVLQGLEVWGVYEPKAP